MYSPHALTTLTAVKDQLRLRDDAQDLFLMRNINAVSDVIARYCGRHFERADYVERYRGHSRQRLMLNQYPVLAVTGVRVDGSDLSPEEYVVLADEGVLYHETGWPWSGHFAGLVGEPTAPRLNIEVEYTAGYVLPKDEDPEANPPVVRTLPYDLEDACISLVAVRYEMRGSEHMRRETIGPLTSEFLDGAPARIRDVLDHYRKPVVA